MQNQSSLILASQQSAARSLSLERSEKDEVLTLEKSVVFMDQCGDDLDGEADWTADWLTLSLSQNKGSKGSNRR